MATFRLTPKTFRQIDRAYRTKREQRITVAEDDRTSAIAYAVLVEGVPQAEAGRQHNVSKQWVSKVIASYYRVCLELGRIDEEPEPVSWITRKLELPEALVEPLAALIANAKLCKDQRVLQSALASVARSLKAQASKLE